MTDNNSIPADAPLNAKGREELGLPPRMTLREELNLIGCHRNGDARCTCVVAQDAIAEIDRLRSALESIHEISVEPAERNHESVREWIEVESRIALNSEGCM